MRNAIIIDTKDNVAVSIEPLQVGDVLEFGKDVSLQNPVVVSSDVPLFHKVALQSIPKGAPVIKYGEYIGVATHDIDAGSWVHVHNMESSDSQKQAC